MATAPSTTRTRIETIGGRPVDRNAPVLEVQDLQVEFRIEDGIVAAVNGLGYKVHEGETIAILGESGSGKSVSAQAVMGILDTPPGYVTAGSVKFRGVELLDLPDDVRAREVRGSRIAMVFQDALTALNPVFTVGWQIGELFRKHLGLSKKEARERAVELLERVKIPSARDRVNAYPHEFSGGMRQRVMIAMALALDPDIIIADEPTTALDVTVQAQIMELFADLQAESGMGLVLITHDLGVVAEVADHVVVMYAGARMEEGPIDYVFDQPTHPYTQGLMNSIARPDVHLERLMPISGSPPDLLHIPSGCPFHPRCPHSQARCISDVPIYEPVGTDHMAACHFWREIRDGRA